MTRDVKLRAAIRRQGVFLEIDREEGKVMAACMVAGERPDEIARRHGVSTQKVQRRLYTMGLYKLVSTGCVKR